MQAPGRRAFFETFAASIAIQAATIVVGAITARVLGPDGRGVYAGAQVLPMIIAGVSFFGVNHALTLRAGKATDEREALSTLALLLSACLSVFSLLAAFVSLPLLLSEQAAILEASFIYTPIIPIFIFTSMLISLDFGLGHFGHYNVSRLFLIAVNALGVVGLALAGIDDPAAYLGVLLAANFAALLYRLSFVRVVPLRETPGFDILMKGGAFYLATLTQIARDQIERLFLVYVLAVAELGYYAVAFSAAMMPSVLAKSFGVLVFSRSAIAGAESGYNDVARAFRLLLVVNALVSGAFAVAMPFVIPLVFGSAFEPAVAVALVLLLAQFALALSTVLDEGMRGKDCAQYGAFGNLLMAITFVGIAYAVIDASNALEVATAGVIGHVSALIYIIFAFLRRAPDVRLVPTAADLKLLFDIAHVLLCNAVRPIFARS